MPVKLILGFLVFHRIFVSKYCKGMSMFMNMDYIKVFNMFF